MARYKVKINGIVLKKVMKSIKEREKMLKEQKTNGS
jgi:hypothetical protein